MEIDKDTIREEKPYELVRTHTCGELRIGDVGKEVTIAGWVQLARDKNHFVFVDLRDRYGITQVVVHLEKSPEYYELARKFGREWVIRVKGTVVERSAKNDHTPTGDIEIVPTFLEVLNESKVPPFTIKDKTDGKELLRMQYRYLDIRRNPVREKLILRHKTAQVIRNYLSNLDFIEVETPMLIKSTPEGARDFVVPSRMNPGTFYALPQSPQTFKQLLMVAGMDKYFQITKCFRDEELRADRQPEFTQIDCEMSYVDQEDVMNTFEGLIRHAFKELKGVDIGKFERMSYDHGMKYYGVDKPDLRFDMKIVNITDLAKGKEFPLFEAADKVLGLCLKGGAPKYSKKKIAELTKIAKGTEVQASALVFVKVLGDGKFQSGVGKFFSDEDLTAWAERFGAEKDDIIFLVCGEEAHDKIQIIAGRLRTYLAKAHDLVDPSVYKPLWVVDFPLLEWDDEAGRYNACHHPFTSPYKADIALLDTDPGKVRARAYDMVINGVEVGGGSIRIHDRATQQLMLKHLGFSEADAEEQFGFLMKAFEYGAPPHGGLAFGMDRLVSLIGEFESIRECIAFPKNNQGKDVMIDAPGSISEAQLKELNLALTVQKDDAATTEETA